MGGLSVEEAIGGAADAGGAAVEDVRVDPGRGDVLVAEEFLDGPDVGSVFEEMGREGMPEGVAGRALGEAGGEDRAADGLLEDRLEEMVAAAVEVEELAHPGAVGRLILRAQVAQAHRGLDAVHEPVAGGGLGLRRIVDQACTGKGGSCPRVRRACCGVQRARIARRDQDVFSFRP